METILQTFYSSDRQRRVVIYGRQNGSFGFREEKWGSEPLEQCWLPALTPKSFCDSADTATQEAAGRIPWLALV